MRAVTRVNPELRSQFLDLEPGNHKPWVPHPFALFWRMGGKPRTLRGRWSRRSAQNDRLAAGLLDLLDSRLGELVRVNGDRRRQLAGAKNLDQRLLGRGQAKLLVVVESDLFHFEWRDAIEIDDRVFGAEDVGETALGQAAVQRHLAAFKTAHQAEAGSRTLALVAAGRCLAPAGSHAPG